MCGIAASIPADEQFVAGALMRLGVRGPDSAAIVRIGETCLGATRLATTGLNSGALPRVSDDGTRAAALNGQIYNFRQLAALLGLSAPESDSDVLLPLFEEWGAKFGSHLRGMFATVIAEPNRLIVTTDHFGVKPLYWVREPARGHHYLASTLQAFPDQLRRHAVRLPPGATITTDNEYFELDPLTTETLCKTALSHSISKSWSDLLQQACIEQAPTELPFAVLLSGGVDSSLLAAILRQHFDRITTVTCGLRGSPDFDYARKVARLIGSDHIEVVIDEHEIPSLVRKVVETTASFEPFLVTGGIPTFVAARALHETGYRVAISGEGADELFAGYDDFDDIPLPLLDRALLAQQHDLGATEALRLDRCTMACSVEARVPYLDQRLVAAVRALPVIAKRTTMGGRDIRKYALRRFAETLLPSEIAWRTKVGFTVGSGVSTHLASLADKHIRDGETRSQQMPGYAAESALQRWLLDEWTDIFGDSIATSWEDLQNRGLVRQSFNLYSFGQPQPVGAASPAAHG